MGWFETEEDWSLSTICWYAVFVWFGASLFSQSLYMALNGAPYEANQLLSSIGPFAWIVICVEIIVWLFVAIAIGRRVINRLQVKTPEITSAEQIIPQT